MCSLHHVTLLLSWAQNLTFPFLHKIFPGEIFVYMYVIRSRSFPIFLPGPPFLHDYRWMSKSSQFCCAPLQHVVGTISRKTSWLLPLAGSLRVQLGSFLKPGKASIFFSYLVEKLPLLGPHSYLCCSFLYSGRGRPCHQLPPGPAWSHPFVSSWKSCSLGIWLLLHASWFSLPCSCPQVSWWVTVWGGLGMGWLVVGFLHHNINMLKWWRYVMATLSICMYSGRRNNKAGRGS